MKKRLMIALAAGALLVGMVPGVAQAGGGYVPYAWEVSFVGPGCTDTSRVTLSASFIDDLILDNTVELEGCRVASVTPLS